MESIENEIVLGSFIVAELLAVHPFPSLIDKSYSPAHRFEMSAVVSGKLVHV